VRHFIWNGVRGRKNGGIHKIRIHNGQDNEAEMAGRELHTHWSVWRKMQIAHQYEKIPAGQVNIPPKHAEMQRLRGQPHHHVVDREMSSDWMKRWLLHKITRKSSR